MLWIRSSVFSQFNCFFFFILFTLLELWCWLIINHTVSPYFYMKSYSNSKNQKINLQSSPKVTVSSLYNNQIFLEICYSVNFCQNILKVNYSDFWGSLLSPWEYEKQKREEIFTLMYSCYTGIQFWSRFLYWTQKFDIRWKCFSLFLFFQ